MQCPVNYVNYRPQTNFGERYYFQRSLSLYDVTSSLAACSHVPSRGGGLWPWSHVPSRGLCPWEILSMRVSVQGRICPGGSLSRGVSVQGVFVGRPYGIRKTGSAHPTRMLSCFFLHLLLINSDQHIRYWRDIAHSYSSACGQLGCFNEPVRPVGSQLWLWSLFLWSQTDGPKGDFTEFVTIGGSLARPANSDQVVLFVCKFSSLWQKRQVWQVSIDFVKVIKLFGK